MFHKIDSTTNEIRLEEHCNSTNTVLVKIEGDDFSYFERGEVSELTTSSDYIEWGNFCLIDFVLEMIGCFDTRRTESNEFVDGNVDDAMIEKLLTFLTGMPSIVQSVFKYSIWDEMEKPNTLSANALATTRDSMINQPWKLSDHEIALTINYIREEWESCFDYGHLDDLTEEEVYPFWVWIMDMGFCSQRIPSDRNYNVVDPSDTDVNKLSEIKYVLELNDDDTSYITAMRSLYLRFDIEECGEITHLTNRKTGEIEVLDSYKVFTFGQNHQYLDPQPVDFEQVYLFEHQSRVELGRSLMNEYHYYNTGQMYCIVTEVKDSNGVVIDEETLVCNLPGFDFALEELESWTRFALQNEIARQKVLDQQAA